MKSRNLSEEKKTHPEHKYSVIFVSKVGTIIDYNGFLLSLSINFKKKIDYNRLKVDYNVTKGDAFFQGFDPLSTQRVPFLYCFEISIFGDRNFGLLCQ